MNCDINISLKAINSENVYRGRFPPLRRVGLGLGSFCGAEVRRSVLRTVVDSGGSGRVRTRRNCHGRFSLHLRDEAVRRGHRKMDGRGF